MSEYIFDDVNFETEVLQSEQPVLVDFYADWCGPCKLQGPIIEEIATEIGDRCKVGKLNVDQAPKTAQMFDVMSIPTLIIFKDGKAVETLMGLHTKDMLVDKLTALVQ